MKIPKEGSLLQDARSRDFPEDPVAKKPPSNAGDVGSIPGPERSHMWEDPTRGVDMPPKIIGMKNTLSLSHVTGRLNIIFKLSAMKSVSCYY